MKKILVSLFVLTVAVGCNAQNDKSNSTLQNPQDHSKPKVDWKVNKEYDEKGNLIRYDSTYTWSYSSKSGDKLPPHADSLFNSMQRQFSQQFSSMFDWNINMPDMELGFTDSLFMPQRIMKRQQQHVMQLQQMMRSFPRTKPNSELKPPASKTSLNVM